MIMKVQHKMYIQTNKAINYIVYCIHLKLNVLAKQMLCLVIYILFLIIIENKH